MRLRKLLKVGTAALLSFLLTFSIYRIMPSQKMLPFANYASSLASAVDNVTTSPYSHFTLSFHASAAEANKNVSHRQKKKELVLAVVQVRKNMGSSGRIILFSHNSHDRKH
jgi:hypothetical protein